MNFNRKLKILAPLAFVFILAITGTFWFKNNKATKYEISADTVCDAGMYFDGDSCRNLDDHHDPDCINGYSYDGNNCVSDGGGTTPPTSNAPTIENENTCGIDVTIVMDMTGSMSDSERTTMKTAMKNFVDAFISTPTRFSLVTYGASAVVAEGFSANNGAAIKTKIDAATVPTEDGTNWEDALIKAKSTLVPDLRPNKSNLVLFASDGEPNMSAGNPYNGSGSQAISAALIVANEIKAMPKTRLIGIAIGADSGGINNFKTIAGNVVSPNSVPIGPTTNVISSGFDNMAASLFGLFGSMCNDSIVVQAQVDTDGDGDADINGDTADPTISGFGFSLTGPSSASSQTTTSSGLLQYAALSVGNYSITETPKEGYSVSSIECTQGGATVGNISLSTKTVSNIPISLTTNAYCTFLNKLTPEAAAIPKIGLSVSVSPTGLPIGGGRITFFYTVTNPSSVPLENVSISDKQCSPITRVGGDSNSDNMLQNSESWRYTCSRTTTTALTSDATVTGFYNSVAVTAPGTASVSIIPAGPPQTGKR